MPTVSLVTVTFNSSDELPGLVSSIAGSRELFREVVAVDNASTDGSADMFASGVEGASVMRNTGNTGFAAAANRGIEATSSEYVLLVNPDVSFGPEMVESLVRALEGDPKAGSAAPLLMRPDRVTVDSAGLVMHRTRKAKDRGRDRPASSLPQGPARIFGPCGAASLYRRSALDDARVDGEFFDESFFAYKEDVDLAWRMNLLGWDSLYVPQAVGVHARGWKTGARREIPKSVRRHSHKNRYLCIIKNDDLSNVLLHLPSIAFYELMLFAYALFSEPFLFGAFSDVWRLREGAMLKRLDVMKRRKRTPGDMRRLLGR